jgi:hypothetical protein
MTTAGLHGPELGNGSEIRIILAVARAPTIIRGLIGRFAPGRLVTAVHSRYSSEEPGLLG